MSLLEMVILLKVELLSDYQGKGLCSISRILVDKNLISPGDRYFLMDELMKKAQTVNTEEVLMIKPNAYSSNGYWWPFGWLRPRLQFLDWVITDLEK